MKYVCNCCGAEHDEWPALAFNSPDQYNILSRTDKVAIVEINSDLCVIRHPDQTDRFIRCTLNQRVVDHCRYLEYGVWVSLSEKSYNDYTDNFNNEYHEEAYFGWLCNNIPGYEFNQSIPTTVFTKKGNQRPEVVPHEGFDHPFVKDYYDGISKQEAEMRLNALLNPSSR